MPLAADTAPVWALSFVVPLGGCFVVECPLVSADTFSLFAACLLCFLLVFVGHSPGRCQVRVGCRCRSATPTAATVSVRFIGVGLKCEGAGSGRAVGA